MPLPYSYLHLPMLAGIVFVALGVRKTLAHIGGPLGSILSVALCGGVALYLLGHSAFRLRDAGSISSSLRLAWPPSAAPSFRWAHGSPPS